MDHDHGLLLACPLLHVFHGHGGHGDRESKPDQETAQEKEVLLGVTNAQAKVGSRQVTAMNTAGASFLTLTTCRPQNLRRTWRPL